jgi:hypothetical protein
MLFFLTFTKGKVLAVTNQNTTTNTLYTVNNCAASSLRYMQISLPSNTSFCWFANYKQVAITSPTTGWIPIGTAGQYIDVYSEMNLLDGTCSDNGALPQNIFTLQVTQITFPSVVGLYLTM